MNARHAEINAKLNAQGIHTKGDILERIQRRERPILWSVKGSRVMVKTRRDGKPGYLVFSPDSGNAAHVMRLESCFDAEGIQAFLNSERGRTRRLWTFDRHGNATPTTY